MTQLVQPRLVNPPDGDPGVYLDFRFGRRAMLFDLGSLQPLTPRELLRVTHAFVSHSHMDHVAGFDHLLRLRLNRPRALTLIGPDGFVRQTESRLGAFSWNLLNATSVDFRLVVHEFDGRRLSAAAEFRAPEAFRRRDLPPPILGDGLVLAEDDLVVEAVALDHGIPSLAFAGVLPAHFVMRWALSHKISSSTQKIGVSTWGLQVSTPWWATLAPSFRLAGRGYHQGRSILT